MHFFINTLKTYKFRFTIFIGGIIFYIFFSLPNFVLSVDNNFSSTTTSVEVIGQYKQDPTQTSEIKLPPPQKGGGKPFLNCINLRKTIRDIDPKELPSQILSDLLWCACGVNRPESGRRTIASAKNWQIVKVIVVLPNGAYWYNEKQHILQLITAKDIRKLISTQEYAQKAYLNVIFVADFSKFPQELSEDTKLLYSAYEVGAISQNIYLYCASADLATVVRASFNKEELTKELSLAEHFKILLVQTVGYTAK